MATTGAVTVPDNRVVPYNVMVRMSKPPNSTISLTTVVTGGTQGDPGDFIFSESASCETIEFASTDTGDDLTKTCGILVLSSGKTLTLTLTDGSGAAMRQGFTINPAAHMVTLNSP